MAIEAVTEAGTEEATTEVDTVAVGTDMDTTRIMATHDTLTTAVTTAIGDDLVSLKFRGERPFKFFIFIGSLA